MQQKKLSVDVMVRRCSGGARHQIQRTDEERNRLSFNRNQDHF